MPALVLGPILRHVGPDCATVWVETDSACTVAVLGHEAQTFTVDGHHYALVVIRGLEAGTTTPYEVHLDGERHWPQPHSRFRPSVIRTPRPKGPVRISFGSCRTSWPHEPPYDLTKDEDPRGREVDALRGLAQRMNASDPQEWPHALLMLGDQIYADEVPPGTVEFIRSRRDPALPPGETIADFEEYTALYRESWAGEHQRWLMSTVSVSMIFDDHDVVDDWNTSDVWVSAMRATGWWDERITGAFMSYWLYQHLGNLTVEALETDALWLEAQRTRDLSRTLRDFAWRADRRVETAQWSFARDIGPARLVCIDSRAGRVLEPGERRMVDDREWEFVRQAAAEPHRHLLLGTSLPWLMGPGLHYLEAWNEAVCDGAWGAPGRRLGEKLRQDFDLEHWAAFGNSFLRMCELVRDIGTGACGEPPETIIALSGDVHHAYLAEVAYPRSTRLRSRVYQAVCSPFRNPLDSHERAAMRFATSRAGALVGRLIALSAGVPKPPIRWRTTHDEPWFDNMLATLDLAEDGARLTLERAGPEEDRVRLDCVYAKAL